MIELDLDLKVLIVDDAESMRRIVRSVLRNFGYKDIQEADNGKDGLAKLRMGDYGLVLADWNMPEMTGIELLRTIKKDPKLSELPVVMLTSEKDKQHMQEAEQAGVSGYITKPFTQEELDGKLRQIFHSSPICRPEDQKDFTF